MTTQRTLLALGDSLTEGYGLPLEHALPAVLERKLRSEPQLNRKVSLRRELIAKQAELDQTR